MSSSGLEETAKSSDPSGKPVAFPVGSLVADALRYWEPLRGSWTRLRWILFLVGLAFAAVIARFFSIATFGSYGGE